MLNILQKYKAFPLQDVQSFKKWFVIYCLYYIVLLKSMNDFIYCLFVKTTAVYRVLNAKTIYCNSK